MTQPPGRYGKIDVAASDGPMKVITLSGTFGLFEEMACHTSSVNTPLKYAPELCDRMTTFVDEASALFESEVSTCFTQGVSSWMHITLANNYLRYRKPELVIV